MMPVGFMAWRVGSILDVSRQLDWILEAGFDAVGFHASPGAAGEWQGVDPATCRADARRALRRALARFRAVEIHAPFASALAGDASERAVAALRPVLEQAGDVEAHVVTVHGQLPDPAADCGLAAWRAALGELGLAASACGTRIGLEVTAGFELLCEWALPRVGVTLDVGHLVAGRYRSLRGTASGSGGLAARLAGILDDAVRALGPALVHLHVHDFDSRSDHLELGTGLIDFSALVAALVDVGYDGALMLELNPDRVSPAGIRRSEEFVRRCLREAEISGGSGKAASI